MLSILIVGRAALPARAQATNLALGKLVTCSSIENTSYPCSAAVDGNTGTRWSSVFSDPQWIQVDLGATCMINRVVLSWEAAYGRSYQIQVSANASTWTNIYSTTTGDGGTDDLTGLSGSGRYVRMNGTVRATGWGYSLWEFEVYSSGGTPPPTTSPPLTPPPTTQPGQAPYGGTPAAIPGTIQAESYDTGGEGVAYHDTTSGNSGNLYRTDGVDVEATTDSGGGYNVGWTAAGEWLEYTVNVAASGTYTLNARAASQAGGGSLHMEVDGANVPGTIAIPSTGAWQTWTTVSKPGISLAAGQHVLRIAEDAAGFNLNWISLQGGTTPPTTPPPMTPPPPTTPGNGYYYSFEGSWRVGKPTEPILRIRSLIGTFIPQPAVRMRAAIRRSCILRITMMREDLAGKKLFSAAEQNLLGSCQLSFRNKRRSSQFQHDSGQCIEPQSGNAE